MQGRKQVKGAAPGGRLKKIAPTSTARATAITVRPAALAGFLVYAQVARNCRVVNCAHHDCLCVLHKATGCTDL